MLDYIRSAFWRFTPRRRPARRGRELEPMLRAGLGAGELDEREGRVVQPHSERGDDAGDGRHGSNGSGGARSGHCRDCRLRETDEADLAADLAVRDVPPPTEILAAQLERLQNPDRKARFAFVMPALSRDAAVRERFFDELRDRARTGRAKPGCSTPRATCTIRCAPPRRRSTSGPALELVRGDPADGRHLLPEALGRRDAQRLPVGADRRRGPRVHRRAAGRLPAAAALGAAVVGRSAVPRGDAFSNRKDIPSRP